MQTMAIGSISVPGNEDVSLSLFYHCGYLKIKTPNKHIKIIN